MKIRFRVWDEVMFYPGIIDDPGERYYLAQDGKVWCGLEEIKDADVWGNDTDNKWVVKWDKFHGTWDTGGGVTPECGTYKTVIGNIYENPNLLEVCE